MPPPTTLRAQEALRRWTDGKVRSCWTFHVERDKKKPTARQSQRNKHLAGGVATYLRHVSLRYEWHHKGLFSGTVCFSTHFLKRASRSKGQSLIWVFFFWHIIVRIMYNEAMCLFLDIALRLRKWKQPGFTQYSWCSAEHRHHNLLSQRLKKSPWNCCAVVCCLSICICANCEELLF